MTPRRSSEIEKNRGVVPGAQARQGVLVMNACAYAMGSNYHYVINMAKNSCEYTRTRTRTLYIMHSTCEIDRYMTLYYCAIGEGIWPQYL